MMGRAVRCSKERDTHMNQLGQDIWKHIYGKGWAGSIAFWIGPPPWDNAMIIDVSDNVVRGICKVNQRILKVVSDIHVSGTSHFLDAVWICRHHYHVGNVFRATKSSGITVPLAATFIHMGREAGRKKV